MKFGIPQVMESYQKNEGTMILNHNFKVYQFEKADLCFSKFDLENLFAKKNNKTVEETLAHPRYKSIAEKIKQLSEEEKSALLGDFLVDLKNSNDSSYKLFLNSYGDQAFCKFKLTSHLENKGLYCWVLDGEVQYLGRCLDSFKKRVNQGYGGISPKNCFIDGQATNCHLNGLINSNRNVEYWVHCMDDCENEEISKLELEFLSSYNFNWNIQNN